MTIRGDALPYWFTLTEVASDRRTDATALLSEGLSGHWKWTVKHAKGRHDGTSANQKAARAAARRFVRKLPDKEKK